VNYWTRKWNAFQEWLDAQRAEDEEYEWRRGFMDAIEQRLFFDVSQDDLLRYVRERVLDPYYTGVIAGSKYELTSIKTTWRIH
jgi:hypothetical protein